MARSYRFNIGDRVRIRATKASSAGVKANDGKVVTIKARSPITWAYELVELPYLWADACLVPI